MEEAIVWHDGFLYAAWGTGLRVYEARGTSAPRGVGGTLLPLQADTAALSWPHLYIVDAAPQWPAAARQSGAGIATVDVRDPSHPKVVGVFYGVSEARNVAVFGDRLLVADGRSGVVVLDASAPSALRHVGSIPVDDARWVAVSDATAYVADASAGLRVLDLRGEPEPLLVATLPNPRPNWPLFEGTPTPTPSDYTPPRGNDVRRVFVDPTRASRVYVTYEHGWRIVDVTDVRAPRAIGGWDVGHGSPLHIVARGDTVFESHTLCMVTVYDTRDPLRIVARDGMCPKSGGGSALGDGVLYRLNGYWGELIAIDVTDLDNLSTLWEQTVPHDLEAGVVPGQSLMVGGTGLGGGLQSFDLTRRGLPEAGVATRAWPLPLEGRLPTVGSYGVAAISQDPDMADVWALRHDVSPPMASVRFSFEIGSREITQLSATDNLMLVAQGRQLKAWSLHDREEWLSRSFSRPISDALAIDAGALVSTSEGMLHSLEESSDGPLLVRRISCHAKEPLTFIGVLQGAEVVFARTSGDEPELRRYSLLSLEETGRWRLPARTLSAALDVDQLYVLTDADEIAALTLSADRPPVPIAAVAMPWASTTVSAAGGYVALGGAHDVRVLRRTE